MKKLSLIPIYQDSSFATLSELVGRELPNEFIEFMKIYGGRAVQESIFINEKNKSYSINNYLPPWEVNALIQTWAKSGDTDVLPFAVEGSGSYVCYSLNTDSYGEITLSREKADGIIWFKSIAKSFDFFVENLITPKEFEIRYFGQK